MKSLSEKILARLKVVATVVAVAVVAVAASAVVAPQRAWAAEPTYENTPLCDISGFEEIKDAPGFKWVSAEKSDDGVPHYLIYNPVEGYEGSHESGIGWWYFAYYSRIHSFEGYLIRLDSDLSYKDYEFERDGGDANQLSVGSEDLPFAGTFDGCGHTISNLTNNRDGLRIQMDNGFFGWTNTATIKNINFKDCYVGGSYRDGLVAGYARDTFFLNITAEDCTTSVIPANNVLNLITNAGISGGTIAGVANGCTLYNCEMRAGRVVTNATAGVAALGGQPLYMGGLVGQANDTVIEYCRVTDKLDEDGNRVYAQVQNRYDTAVSVANYSEVFTGGIVGCMQGEDTGSKIVDCYSTADVYSYAAIRFAVGLGLGVTRGYTGGIAGIVREGGDGQNLIQRVSFAGNLRSYNYNILLLGIPIIEEDAYMGGITGRGGNNATIDQAYFMRHTNGLGMGSSTSKDIYAVKTTYNGGYTDGAAYGSRDGSYADRGFWEGCGFDLAGGTLRNYDYEFTEGVDADEWNVNHYNKWVMDYTRGIPVHGGSIKATMDFPGSGTVTIGTTGLAPKGSEQSTSDPYDFAVQGYEQGDESIELTYEFTTKKNESWAADERNQGFRFMGWYRSRDVRVNDIAKDHSLFTQPNSTLNTEDGGLLSDSYLVAADAGDASQPDMLTVTKPGDEQNPGTADYSDNDLYVAYAQAQVLLHDVGGNVVNTSGAAEEDATNDWYDYGDTITLPTSVSADASQGGNFIGWTTRANTQDGNDIGYTAIDSATLAQLRADGVLWEPGDIFTVTEPANLYPVYSQYDNITVIYEGHDENTLDTRTGYGSAVKTPGDDGLVLSVQPSDAKSPLVARTVRFLGWYEYVGDETTAEAAEADTANWLRVSRGESTETPVAGNDCFTYNLTEAGVDLTANHIYKARFEYRVEYWASSSAHEGAWQLYEQVWHRYSERFDNIIGPDTEDRAFLHWSEEEVPVTDGLLGCDEQDAFTGEDGGAITMPHVLCAHHDASGGNQHFLATTDFPAVSSAVVENITHTAAQGARFTASYDQGDVKLLFWSFNRNTEADNTLYVSDGASNPWEIGRAGGFVPTGKQEWAGMAHIQARVTYHGLVGVESEKTVWRVENEPVRLEHDTYNEHEYYYDRGVIENHASLSEASPTDASMVRQGYIFLGWLDMSDPEVASVQDRIIVAMGDDSGAYLATTPTLVVPYLMTGKEVCTRPMDLYPVYTRFLVNTTTNIAEAGVDATIYHIPQDPAISDGFIADAAGTAFVTFNDDASATVSGTVSTDVSYDASYNGTVKVTVDNDTSVWVDSSQGGGVYTFSSLSVYEDGVLARTVPASEFTAGSTAGTMTSSEAIPIAAAHNYELVANYSPVPVTVTYHLGEGGDGSTEQFVCEVGDLLPSATSTPSFEDYGDFFYGWTVGDANGYVQTWSEDITLVQPGVDRVTGAMHLWPVYRDASITVDSNIDGEAGTNHRGQRVTSDGQGVEIWAEQSVQANGQSYAFKGWSTTGDSSEIVSTSLTFLLFGDSRFPDPSVTYTAVYEQSEEYVVNYHDMWGNVIYTVAVDQNDRRSFVETTEDPQNPGQQITSPLDAEAFAAIIPTLSDGEVFSEWEWIYEANEGDGTSLGEGPVITIPWNEFAEVPVKDSAAKSGNVMNLYPVTYQLIAQDSKGEPYEDITWLIEKDRNDGLSLRVTLTQQYEQPELSITLFEQHKGFVLDDPSTVYIVPIPVRGCEAFLYGDGGADADTYIDQQTTDELGRAVFTFDGLLEITKQSSDPDAAGRTFAIDVTSADDPGESRTVLVTVGEEPGEDGLYRGKATIALPYGKYVVSEDAEWAWRYESDQESYEETVGYAGLEETPDGGTALAPTRITVSNEFTGKWFDGEDYRHNVFDEKGGE